MTKLKLMSLNGEDMIELIPKSLAEPRGHAAQRGKALGELIEEVDPDVLGLVEAPPRAEQTQRFNELYLGGEYAVYQGEKRGTLGLALLVRKSLELKGKVRTKVQSNSDFALREHDSDNDGIREVYSWVNRVPLEVEISGGGLAAPATAIVIHSKSKGVFIPGDLYAYERVSRANRMKLKAQAAAVRKRIDGLIDGEGKGRVIVMGDFNDGPEFDVDAQMIGGGFLEPVMGSVWDPKRVMHNPHIAIKSADRWTIDYADRILNPLGQSKYGQPTTMRSWIDHILFSPELATAVVPESAQIKHHPTGGGSPTDHHPPYVTVEM
ncbi:MAG TPA: endonuclease/exonuclease/phosphatase family protein [Solirubrobacterales bacterium]|nr:endonuclease/exonuclease/phosphatase family protein [Solirubrobacterales bacterium]